MMTSSNGIIFRVTGPLCGELTGPGEFPTQRPVTRSFDVFFFICVRINGWVNNREACDLRRHRAHYDVNIMKSTLPLIRWPQLSIASQDFTNTSLRHTQNSRHLTSRIYLCWQQDTLPQNVLRLISPLDAPNNTLGSSSKMTALGLFCFEMTSTFRQEALKTTKPVR